MELRFGLRDGVEHTQKEVADSIGISQSYISRLEKRIIKRLRSEIGAKLADNYVRQIMTDGFFHADPHPGNIRIRDGKIVWLDMGMMGTLTERQRKLIGQAITGVARGDISLCRDAVMGLGEFKEKAEKLNASALPRYRRPAG